MLPETRAWAKFYLCAAIGSGATDLFCILARRNAGMGGICRCSGTCVEL